MRVSSCSLAIVTSVPRGGLEKEMEMLIKKGFLNSWSKLVHRSKLIADFLFSHF